MAEKKTMKAVFEEVKQREKRNRLARENARIHNTDSENELVIDDENDPGANGLVKKRYKGVRMEQEPVSLTCSWLGCSDHFTIQKEFIKHLMNHSYETEPNNSGLYLCEIANCCHESLSLEFLTKHVAFHAYHERMKNVGQNLTDRLKLPQCAYPMFEVPAIYHDYLCKYDSCTKVFGVIHEFLVHIKVHVQQNPKYTKKGEYIYCGWEGCSSKFSSQYKLGDHMRSHTKEKTIACPSCGNLFASKTKLADHRKRQIPFDLQSYQCSECKKRFPSEKLLRDHMRGHINHYKCSMCDMTCHKPSMLAKHIRFRHLNERPYKCNLCEHTCVSKNNLENHLTTHCADDLIACEDCDFTCRSLYGLERHYIVVHGTGSAPTFACHCCEKTFKRGGHLTKHLMKIHGFNWPSGHSRFRYKEDNDGIYRLQTVRYESLEVTEEMMNSSKPPTNSNAKYNLQKSEDKNRFLLMVSDSGEENVVYPTNHDIIMRIDDVDTSGKILRSEIVNSKEIVSTELKCI